MTVELHFRGVTDHEALEPASLPVERGQTHQAPFEFFPFGHRVDEQAVVSIDGHDELSGTQIVDPLAIPGRDREAALGIYRNFAGATKH